jgi:hypothetical protein
MTLSKKPKLNITNAERTNLRKAKIKISALLDFSPDELEVILEASSARVKELFALAEFQQVPSVGVKFAEDLIFLGYFSLAELADKDGGKLLEEYEKKKGFWVDPCVEDQFRLIVAFAKSPEPKRNWWDFTRIRKAYRIVHGYPADRPTTPWHEVVPIKRGKSK